MILAIATDPVEATAKLQSRLPGVVLLTDLDPGLAAVTAWGLRVGDAEHPWPATFLVGSDGLVRWRHLGDGAGDWPALAELAAAVRGEPTASPR